MSIILGLESRRIELQGDEIVIGRCPAAQVSLVDDARLAERHAVLRLVGTRWMIEAQGDAAIRVGTGHPTKVAWLYPGDVIHLTDAGPMLTFCPSGTAPHSAAPFVPPQFPPADSGPLQLGR